LCNLELMSRADHMSLHASVTPRKRRP
jgi:hypothetical protein